MNFELSDADIMAIHEVVESQDIKDRAQYLIRQNLFESVYPGQFSAFIFQVFEIAEKKGKLANKSRKGTCAICGKGKHIPLFKSGPRKGGRNYDKTWYEQMTDFEESSVTLEEYTPNGVCKECLPSVKSEMAKILDVQIPIFQWKDTITSCPVIRDIERKCFKCEETIFESEMGHELAMFGGTHPAICPKCQSKGTHRKTGVFRLIERKEDKHER